MSTIPLGPVLKAQGRGFAMKKVLVAYDSETGKTKQMAEYIAEGICSSGHDADVKRINEIKSQRELEGYDAYLFGSPTYNLDMLNTMKTFLSMARDVNLYGKVGGAFGSYSYSGDAPRSSSTPWIVCSGWTRSNSGRLTCSKTFSEKRKACAPAAIAAKPLEKNWARKGCLRPKGLCHERRGNASTAPNTIHPLAIDEMPRSGAGKILHRVLRERHGVWKDHL